MGDITHPVLTYSSYSLESVEGLKAQVAYFMGLSEDELVALVPEQNGFFFTGCPNCDGGKQEHQLAWDPKNPEQLTCRYCGHVYPSDDYPVSGVESVTSPAGNVFEFPYWADEKGYRYYFESHRDYQAHEQLAAAAYKMAWIYHLTGEAEYARRAALLLDRFAQVFPDYIYKFDYPFTQKELYDGVVDPSEFRPGYRTSRWSWWAYMDIPIDLVFAYDMIFDSGEIARIPGAQSRIEDDFFSDAAEKVVANNETLSNMAPTAWRAMIAVSRVLDKPEYMHDVVSRLELLAREQFYYDGVWGEGAPSYHSQVIGGLKSVFTLSKGYNDPEGYTYPVTGARYDNLDLEAGLPVVARLVRSLYSMKLPNGRYAPVHDTWSTNGGSALNASEPVLLPGLGHAILGRGAGKEQMQVHLTWSGGYGHEHADGLSMLMFADGEEMLSDIGYTHTRYRPWTLASVAHNTVVVDYLNQKPRGAEPTDGSLQLFDVSNPNMQVVAASNPQVYAGICDTYTRLLAMVGLDETSAYVVDAFIVGGGEQQDYFVHGSADREQTAKLTGDGEITLTPVDTMMPAGMTWKAPEGEHHVGFSSEKGWAYGMLRDTSAAEPGAGVQMAEFDYANADLATRVYMVTEAGDRLFLGTNAQVRTANEDDANLENGKRPYVMVRRSGEGTQDGVNVFTSVFEPVAGEAIIKKVERVATSGNGVCLAIRTSDFVDIVALFADSLEGTFEGTRFAFEGPVCRVRLVNGEVAQAYTSGLVSWGDFRMVAEERTADLLGVESRADGGALIVADDWSDPSPAPGTVLIVDHGDGYTHGYTAVSAEKVAEGTRIITKEDPGFEYDAGTQSATFRYHPHDQHNGKHTVRWQGTASLR